MLISLRFTPLVFAVMALILALAGPTPLRAQQDDTIKNLYSVSGVKVDVSDKDAAQAKLKAISDAQVKAFAILTKRLVSPAAARQLSKLGRREIGRLMASLSVESESTAPGRYIGKFTIRFLQGKVRELFQSQGVGYTENQSQKIVILPVWNGPEGPVIWQDNPWRKAWLDLKAENSIVPVIIPLGDLTDSSAITAQEALAKHETKLGSLMLRYQADAILVAVATPTSKNELRAVMSGESPVGTIAFDKVYKAKPNENMAALAARVAGRFHEVMVQKWKKDGGAPGADTGVAQSFSVSVPFSSISEWNDIRIELLTTPGVTAVDVKTISDSGAVVQLTFTGTFPQLQASLAASRLGLSTYGGQWVLQPN